MSNNGKASWLTRGIDRAIGVLSPRIALRRQVARSQLHSFSTSYRATSTGRTRWSRSDQAGTGDYFLTSSDLESLRSQCRDFDRNNCIFSGLLNRWVDNVIGTGFTFQMRSPDEGLNQAVEERMTEWAEREADFCGVFSLWEMLRLGLREIGTGGDIFFAKISGMLQAIEPDLCVTPIGNTEWINNGVEKDSAGRIVGYHFGQWMDWGGTDNRDTTKVLPDEIFHVFAPKRFSQSRGVPVLSNTIELFERLDDYIEATLVAAQVGACQAVAIKTEMGADLGADLSEATETTTDDEDMPTREMEPGMAWFLRPGESVDPIAPEQPTPQFEPFVVMLIRFAGLELGLPLEMALLDYSKTNYSSAKAAMVQADATTKGWQRTLKSRLLHPLTDWKLPQIFQEVGAEYSPELAKYVWIPPARKWIDPPRESQGHIDAAANGVESYQDIAAEQGKFWRDLMTERAEVIRAAKEVAEELDVDWTDIIPAKGEKAPQESPEQSGVTNDKASPQGGAAV